MSQTRMSSVGREREADKTDAPACLLPRPSYRDRTWGAASHGAIPSAEPTWGCTMQINSRSLTLRAGLALGGVDYEDFWFAYVESGGLAPYAALCFALASGTALPDSEHDIAAETLNGLLVGQGLGCPVAYVRDLVS